MSIYKQDIRAYLEYGPEGEGRRVEITAASITYGRQELPVASIQVATGLDTYDGSYQPDFAELPKADVPARIYVILKGQRGEDVNAQWDEQPKLLFRGYITSFAATRLANRSAANFAVYHWLSKLATANLIASYASPGDSAELVLPAYRRIKQDAGAKGGQAPRDGLFGLLQENIVYVDPGQVETLDLWADIAKPFLLRVSQQNPFSTELAFPSCFPDAGGDNVLALEALALIEGVTTGEYDQWSLTPDDYGVGVRLPDEAPGAIGAAIRANLTRPQVANLMQMSAWSYIISQLCSPYLLSVIPGVSRARIVPFTATYNQVFKELGVNEAVVVDRNRPIDLPILATTMSAGTLKGAGAQRAEGTQDPFAFGPCYSPEGIPKSGVVRQIAPPPWLQTAQFSAFDPANTTRVIDGVGAGFMAVSNAEADRVNDTKLVKLRADIDQYGQNYVKAAYGEESLIGRHMKVASYFRGDIGPGSQVKLNVDEDIRGFGNVAYAVVSKVTLTLDANAGMASSLFLLTHVRDENEQQTNYLGLSEHPLFAATFAGAPISSDFE